MFSFLLPRVRGMGLSVIVVLVLVLSVSCGGSSSSTSSGGTTSSDDTSGSDSTDSSLLVTLSGQAAADGEDVSANISAASRFLAHPVQPSFTTVGDTVVPEATVTLVKIEADGTETTEATTTTDENGDYTIEEVPVCETSTGNDDDFYYEVRVSTGDLEITAPVCPSGETEEVTANVSPESTIAATIISDVVDVPGADSTSPVPSSEQFELLDSLVDSNIGELEESVTVPSMAEDTEEDIISFSNGVAAAGGDAEKTYKSFQFESELVFVTSSDEATTDDMAAYLKRVARESCVESQATNTVLSRVAAEALADVLDSGETFTPTEIADAYFDATATEVDLNTKVADYADLLAGIEEAEATETVASLVRNLEDELIDQDTTVAYYTQRDLESADFAEDTELDADQAMTFIQTLADESCEFNQSVDLTDVVAALTGASELADPAISDVTIYNDSGFNCNGQGQGHFMAFVDVYMPNDDSRSVSSVVVTSTDTASLGGDATITLAQNGPPNHFVSQTDANSQPNPGNCVTIDEEVTYTITATLSDSSTVSKTVERTHPQTPEATISLNGEVIATQDAVAVASELRPLISWTSPEDALEQVTGAPDGAQIKYTYELSHLNLDSGNMAGRTGCAQVSSGTALYATDSMIPTVDCDVEACAAADGTTPDKIACRINIQTYLVDENDVLLSQGAGAFRRYCVDLNADGDCGN